MLKEKSKFFLAVFPFQGPDPPTTHLQTEKLPIFPSGEGTGLGRPALSDIRKEEVRKTSTKGRGEIGGVSAGV